MGTSVDLDELQFSGIFHCHNGKTLEQYSEAATSSENSAIDKEDDKGVCVTLMGMPVHEWSLGSPFYSSQFCGPISDDSGCLGKAFHSYRQCRLVGMGLSAGTEPRQTTIALDDGLIDGALMAFRNDNPSCRQFWADMGCTWGDDIQCHADRDQLALATSLQSLPLQYQGGDRVANPRNESTIFCGSTRPTSACQNLAQ